MKNVNSFTLCAVLWLAYQVCGETILKGKLLRKVVKGEELTVCYYEWSLSDGGCLTKEQRKEELVEYGVFECLCDICKEV